MLSRGSAWHRVDDHAGAVRIALEMVHVGVAAGRRNVRAEADLPGGEGRGGSVPGDGLAWRRTLVATASAVQSGGQGLLLP
jgi:hypothetical protein